MTRSRRGWLIRLAVTISMTLPNTMAAAQGSFPERPITIVVPFAGGGASSTLARVVAEHMQSTLGQPVVIESVGGAGGTLAISRVVRAVPDGYTLSLGNFASHVTASAIYGGQHDAIEHLQPISLLGRSPFMLFARKTLPADSLRQFVDWLSMQSGNASAASPGGGSQLCSLHLQQLTGTRFQLVPYRGGAPAIQDVVAGHVDFMCGDGSSALPQVRAGRLKAFAVTTPARWTSAPEIPSANEAGVPNLYIENWFGLWAPRRTPASVVETVNAAVVRALADAGVRQRLAQVGFELPATEQQTPQALGEFHRAEVEKWWPIIRAANIKPN